MAKEFQKNYERATNFLKIVHFSDRFAKYQKIGKLLFLNRSINSDT